MGFGGRGERMNGKPISTVRAQKGLSHKRIDTTAAHYVLDELEPNLTDDLY